MNLSHQAILAWSVHNVVVCGSPYGTFNRPTRRSRSDCRTSLTHTICALCVSLERQYILSYLS